MSRRSPQKPLLGVLLEWRILVPVFFCLTLALAPSLDARGKDRLRVAAAATACRSSASRSGRRRR
jgi:hypothetical protein